MSTVNLFTAQAGDGNSTSFQVTGYAGAISNEGVLLQASGTWNSTTLKLEACANPTASPQVWSTVKNVKDDGTTTDISFTADFSVNLDVVTGAAYRAVLSGSGSPIPSITVDAVGDIE
jgi:hypothetical protein